MLSYFYIANKLGLAAIDKYGGESYERKKSIRKPLASVL